MLEISTRGKDPSVVVLSFSGDLSVLNISEVYQQVMTVPSGADQYDIFIKEIENLDLSFFQLLYAFLKQERTAVISLKWELPDESTHIMHETGLQSVFDEFIRN